MLNIEQTVFEEITADHPQKEIQYTFKPPTLVPADRFSIQSLTDAYNQTRIDYLVPMPLNAIRLAEYIHIYDIDMHRSVVALDKEQILGINMIGSRERCTWVTRLGVLPVRRRRGTGEMMTRYLLDMSQKTGHISTKLEVIKNNFPAYQLFTKLGFDDIRELLIMRRPPNGNYKTPNAQIDWLDATSAIDKLGDYPVSLAWTNQPQSYINAGDAQGIFCELPQGHRGWIIFRKQKFYLSHFVVHTEAGDPLKVSQALLANLHNKFPDMDTHIENIDQDDPHLPVFRAFGYFEAFRRIEMVRNM